MTKMFNLLSLILITSLIFSGCSNLSDKEVKDQKNSDSNINLNDIVSTNSNIIINNNGPTKIMFKDMISIEDLKRLDGKQVEMIGFVSIASPLDGSFIYLMNMPYQSCVFCLPNTNQLVNTMVAYPKKGESLEYVDTPVKITGTLKFEDINDTNGYSYAYRLIDTKMEEADVSGLEEDIVLYTMLADTGYINKHSLLMNELYLRTYMLDNDGMSINIDELTPIDLSMVQELRTTVKSLNNDSKYSEVLVNIDKLEKLCLDVNEVIKSKDKKAMQDLNIEGQNIYSEFYTWLTKPQV